MIPVSLTNQHDFLFLYSEKRGGKQGLRGVAGAAPKEDLSRDESLLKLSQSCVFFLLNDSQAKANQPEIGANSSLSFVSFQMSW